MEAPVPRVTVHARLGRRRLEPEEYDTGREEESDFNSLADQPPEKRQKTHKREL